MSDPDGYTWVPLVRALDLVQSRLITARLDDQGIPVVIRDESANTVIPVSVGMLAEVIVLVPDEYYDRALAVLRDLRLVEEEDEDDEDDDDEDAD
jgi:hypothetical protein